MLTLVECVWFSKHDLFAVLKWLGFVTFAPIVLWLCCHLWMQTRRNLAKLELYRKFTNTLAVSVLLSIAWIGFEVVLGKYIWCTEIINFSDVFFLLEFQKKICLIIFMLVSVTNDLGSLCSTSYTSMLLIHWMSCGKSLGLSQPSGVCFHMLSCWWYVSFGLLLGTLLGTCPFHGLDVVNSVFFMPVTR